MTPNEINQMIRMSIEAYHDDLIESVKSQVRSYYDCSNIDDHLRNAAAEMMLSALELVDIPEVND